MINEIIIVGAGGLGREVLWLLEELVCHGEKWNIKGFADDNEMLSNSSINGYHVLGNTEWLSKINKRISVVCCVANPEFRLHIIKKLQSNPKIEFPNIIAYGTRYSQRVKFGMGNIICLSTTMTVDIEIGDFNIVNPACTIGHDVKMDDYNTIYPGVNVSGNVSIGSKVEIGTGSQIIQGLSICNDTIIGAGSVVIRNINEKGTYVGVPVRKIK